jgi:hypothetical protein
MESSVSPFFADGPIYHILSETLSLIASLEQWLESGSCTV